MNPTTIHPKITLVGAGPGDPELMTMKGMKALWSADVVLYDALVNPDILKEAPENAVKVYVGKRANNHRYSQDEINLMLVQFAFTHGHVVRLKGGDSFVFGRGHEELQFAKAFDIETTVVPGISSCISVPELQEVPLTRRGLNESFWVLTGTTRSGALSEDIQLAAQSSATAVILMGMRKLPQIADIFSAHGKTNTPAMVIQSGSLPEEKVVLGTVKDIAQKVEKEGLGSPGIIIIGEVVKLHPELNYEAVDKSLQLQDITRIKNAH
ncbi:MAG: uroporphyrinogen-III C-methyltransferase [Bacteroidota bacterium]